MNSFDDRAREWDKDKIHMERSVAIAAELEKMIPLNQSVKALEYGAGTGILSFMLKDRFSEITLKDNSQEMINVCNEKVECHKANHIKPIRHDLEHSEYDVMFDIIYNQMVLHHVIDVELILQKFYSLLNPDGYLAIADLYSEDGSFHGPEVKVHWGFDPEKLTEVLLQIGFKNIVYRPCFDVLRESGRKYPLFLLTAKK